MVNIGIIGLGYWGINLFWAFTGVPDCKVKAIADIDKARFIDLPGVSYTPHYKKILADKKIDAVAIATPAETHYEIGMAAIAAGKHIFVEKPFTLDFMEAQILEKIAHHRGRTVMVDHLLRYHQAAEEMIRAVKAGEIGKICYIHAQRIGGKVRKAENVLWSLGPHDLSLIFALVDSPLIAAAAHGKQFLKNDNGIEDVVFTQLTFNNGITANLHFSWMDRFKARRFIVVGTEATIIFDDQAPSPLEFHPSRKERMAPAPPPLNKACKHFVECLKNGQQPLTGAREAVKVVQALHFINLQIKGQL